MAFINLKRKNNFGTTRNFLEQSNQGRRVLVNKNPLITLVELQKSCVEQPEPQDFHQSRKTDSMAQDNFTIAFEHLYSAQTHIVHSLTRAAQAAPCLSAALSHVWNTKRFQLLTHSGVISSRGFEPCINNKYV